VGIEDDGAFAGAMMGSLAGSMTAEDVMMARECLRECLQGMHEWYETAFFPISIRTTSEAVHQSLLTSEKRAAAFGGVWPATYQGAVGPAEAPKVEAGKAAYRSYFPAPFGTSALPVTDQIRAIPEAVHATVSSGGGEGWSVTLAPAVIPNVMEVMREGRVEGACFLLLFICHFSLLSCSVSYFQNLCLSPSPSNYPVSSSTPLNFKRGEKSDGSQGIGVEKAETGKAKRE